MPPSVPSRAGKSQSARNRSPDQPKTQSLGMATVLRSAYINHGKARLSMEVNLPRPHCQVWVLGPPPLQASPQQPHQRQSVGRNEEGSAAGKGDLPPLRLPVPRLPSLPLASFSCTCSTSGLLAKTQVGCSTVPCLAWVWKIWRGQRQVPGDRGPQTCSSCCPECFSSIFLARSLFHVSAQRFPPPGSPA